MVTTKKQAVRILMNAMRRKGTDMADCHVPAAVKRYVKRELTWMGMGYDDELRYLMEEARKFVIT